MFTRHDILQNSDLFSSIINNCADAIISKDLNGNITSWNKGAEELFGYTMNEAIGKNILMLIPESLKNEEEVIQNKIKVEVPVKHYKTKRLTKSGKLIDISISVSPILDQNGKIIGASKIARDISEYVLLEEEARVSNNKYKTLVDSIKDGLMIDDLGGKVIFANQQFMDLFGLTPNDLENLVLEDYVAPEYRPLLRDRHNRRIMGEDVPKDFQYIGIRKDGQRRWMDVHVSELRENGEIIGTQTAIRDITEYKQAEANLLKSLKEIEDYKYALDESSIVATTDQKGIINYVNDYFCKISKYSREELIGEDHRIINSGFHPPAFIKDLWSTIAKGKIWRGEIKNKAKDGSFYWVDTTIVPFKDASGKPFRYIAIRYDITERKNTEEKLIKSDSIYRTIVSHLPGAIVSIIDRDQKFVMAEGSGINQLGLNKEDFINNTSLPIIGEELTEKIKNLRARTFNGEEISIDIELKDKYFRVRYIPLLDANNEVYSIMTISIDITDIKKAERNIKELNETLERKVKDRTTQLLAANRELEAFSYSVSHDLRAPLRIINGYADILVTEYRNKLDEEGTRMLGRVMNNTQRMGKLIDELLNLAQLGRKELQLQPTNMNNLVNNVIEEQSALVNKKINILTVDLPIAYCDSGLIRQVWSNLISNAIKYSNKYENQTIKISFSSNESETIYTVSDNGVGFDMQYIDKLFGVFQRLHKRNEFEGTGVGLALVKRIVSRHGGNVWAEAELNKGAKFYFSLPK